MDIEKFLEGHDNEKYIVAIEYDYKTNKIVKVIDDPVNGKKILTDSFIPFCWVGDISQYNFCYDNILTCF